MRFEHFALNVPDVRTMACWYVEHLGFTVARQRDDLPHTRFLADDTGRLIVELYTNPAAAMPVYTAQHPLVFHFALVAADARAECRRLEQAGATPVLEEPQADGSMLIMMRDPWGVPIQLCQRANPFYCIFPKEVTPEGGAACPQDALGALGTTRATSVTSMRKDQ